MWNCQNTESSCGEPPRTRILVSFVMIISEWSDVLLLLNEYNLFIICGNEFIMRGKKTKTNGVNTTNVKMIECIGSQ